MSDAHKASGEGHERYGEEVSLVQLTRDWEGGEKPIWGTRLLHLLDGESKERF